MREREREGKEMRERGRKRRIEVRKAGTRERERERDPMAEWLEHVLAVREISGLTPGRGGYKNLCGDRGNILTTSVSQGCRKTAVPYT